MKAEDKKTAKQFYIEQTGTIEYDSVITLASYELFQWMEEYHLFKQKEEQVTDKDKNESLEEIRSKHTRAWFNEEDDLDDPKTGHMPWPEVLEAMEEYASQSKDTVSDEDEKKYTIVTLKNLFLMGFESGESGLSYEKAIYWFDKIYKIKPSIEPQQVN